MYFCKDSFGKKKQCSSEDSGQYKLLTDVQRRVTGTPIQSYACAHHVRNVCNANFCSCPITWEHRKTPNVLIDLLRSLVKKAKICMVTSPAQ